jgi:hypothetical protein
MSGTAARPALRSKLAVSLDALLAGDEPWASSSGSHGGPASAQPSPSKRGGKSAAAPRARFYADLLCLPCDAALVRDALGAVSSATLLAPEGTKGARIRENVGSLWREAGRVWREEDAVRMGNAVEVSDVETAREGMWAWLVGVALWLCQSGESCRPCCKLGIAAWTALLALSQQRADCKRCAAL